MMPPLFRRDGDVYHPTRSAGGPWSPDYLHGGPPVGLLAWALEAEAAGSGLRLVRLTTDLLRPVPMAPLTVTVRTVRGGRRLRVLEGVLRADDTVVSHATALYLEQAPLVVPEHGRFHGQPLPAANGPTNSLSGLSGRDGKPASFTPEGLHTTVETRLVDGVQGRGQGRVWMRLPVPVVDDEPASPTVQAASLADFGNGVGQLVVAEGVGSINADVTLYLARAPRGEWIGFDARAAMNDNGNGLVETHLHDDQGEFGRVVQATLAKPTYKKA